MMANGFRRDAVFNHAVVAANRGGAAAAQYQAHAEFVRSAPDGILQLGAGGRVIQVVVIGAGGAARAQQFIQAQTRSVVHQLRGDLGPVAVGYRTQPVVEVLVQATGHALHDRLGKVMVSVD